MEDYIKKLRSGDEKAFERLITENQNKIYAVCLNMLKNPHDAQDAAQESFLKAYRSLHSFSGDSMVETWLTRIAVNTCLDMIRQRKYNLDIDDQYDLASRDTPEDLAEAKRRREILRRAINELTPDMRAVVVLRDIEGYSYEQVSEMLKLNIGTVRSRLSRAREKLKNILLQNRELF